MTVIKVPNDIKLDASAVSHRLTLILLILKVFFLLSEQIQFWMNSNLIPIPSRASVLRATTTRGSAVRQRTLRTRDCRISRE